MTDRPGPSATHDPTAVITLASGRRIQLRRLVRDPTFLNVGEAAPMADVVDSMVRGAQAQARTAFGLTKGAPGGPLVAPPELVKVPSRWPDDVGYLPRWVSCGLFDSDRPTQGADGDGSELVLVWYQDDFAPLFPPAFRSWVEALDWDAHARNTSWDL